MRPRYDVAVIGAGPAGSAAAAAMAQRGWHVALIERSRLPRHKVCGEFLSPESQETLQSLGLRDDLATRDPVPLSGATLSSQRGQTLEMALPSTAWGLSRWAMDEALAHGAARYGATLLTETTVSTVEAEGDDYRLQIRRRTGKAELRARTVLMAGGRSSTNALPPAPSGRPRDQLFVGMKSHVTGITMPNRVELFLFDGGYIGINAVESGALNLCLLARYDAFAQGGRTMAGMIDSIARQNADFAARLRGATLLEETTCTVAAVDTHRPAAPWDGMACLGDTASMIPPLCGDGMAMALRSATLCAPLADAFLRGAIDRATWEQRYRHAWHREFDGRLRVGRSLQSLLSRGPLAEGLLGVGRLVPPLADYMVRATRGAV